MKDFLIKVLHRVVPYVGFGVGVMFAEWIWKHIFGR